LIEPADFPLLETSELNNRKMLGPDQYFGDPVERARTFIARVNHVGASRRAAALVPSSEAESRSALSAYSAR
jgi:hypothetical protein